MHMYVDVKIGTGNVGVMNDFNIQFLFYHLIACLCYPVSCFIYLSYYKMHP